MNTRNGKIGITDCILLPLLLSSCKTTNIHQCRMHSAIYSISQSRRNAVQIQ